MKERQTLIDIADAMNEDGSNPEMNDLCVSLRDFAENATRSDIFRFIMMMRRITGCGQ